MKNYLQYIPFLVTIEGHVKLNGARIMEGIIIAAIAGLMSGYISVNELRVEIMALKTQFIQMETQIRTLDDRLYQHNKDVREEIKP